MKNSGESLDSTPEMGNVSGLPRVSFVKSSDAALEFEAIALSRLYERRREIRPRLDRPHRVDFHHLILFTHGEGRHNVDFQPYDYSPGSMCLIRQGQVQTFELSPKLEGVMLLFTEDFIAKNLTQSDVLALNRFYGYDMQSPIIQLDESTRKSVESLTGEITAEYQDESHFGREEAIRLLLKYLLLRIERVRRTSSPEGESVGRLRAFGEFQNLLLSRLTATRNARDYAAELKMSYRQLNHLCKAVSGKTAKAFIDESFILEAKRRLATTSISIKELSFELGFDDPTNFTQFFKKHAGRLPAQFRKTGS